MDAVDFIEAERAWLRENPNRLLWFYLTSNRPDEGRGAQHNRVGVAHGELRLDDRNNRLHGQGSQQFLDRGWASPGDDIALEITTVDRPAALPELPDQAPLPPERHADVKITLMDWGNAEIAFPLSLRGEREGEEYLDILYGSEADFYSLTLKRVTPPG